MPRWGRVAWRLRGARGGAIAGRCGSSILEPGTSGVPALKGLLESRHEVVGVVTQPDRPVGRKQVMTPSQIKIVAKKAAIPVLQPERIVDGLKELGGWAPEVIVVMAYGQILPQRVLELPGRACINLHASLLPKHRGASPIQAALREGDRESGITVMHVAKGLDTGDMILASRIELAPEERGGSLHDRLAACAPSALCEALDLLESGTASRSKQDEGLATYAPKLSREDGELDWSVSAEQLERLVRAYDPWPGTRTTLPLLDTAATRCRHLKVFPPVTVVEGSGSPGEVLAASGGQLVVATGGGGAVALTELQLEGARRMEAAAFLAGCSLKVGEYLGRDGRG